MNVTVSRPPHPAPHVLPAGARIRVCACADRRLRPHPSIACWAQARPPHFWFSGPHFHQGLGFATPSFLGTLKSTSRQPKNRSFFGAALIHTNFRGTAVAGKVMKGGHFLAITSPSIIHCFWNVWSVPSGRTAPGVRRQFNTPKESPYIALAYMEARCIWCKHQNSSLILPVISCLMVFREMCT